MNILPIKGDSQRGVFFKNSSLFIHELAEYLHGKRVLEVFAGNGLLAGLLAQKGVQVTATTRFSGMDGHDYGLYYPVESMDAPEAVRLYGTDHDVLLMSWPTVTNDAYTAACLMKKPIVIIGDVTDYGQNHLGGCATDDFWAQAKTIKVFESYPGRWIEKAQVVEMLDKPKAQFLMDRENWERQQNFA